MKFGIKRRQYRKHTAFLYCLFPLLMPVSLQLNDGLNSLPYVVFATLQTPVFKYGDLFLSLVCSFFDPVDPSQKKTHNAGPFFHHDYLHPNPSDSVTQQGDAQSYHDQCRKEQSQTRWTHAGQGHAQTKTHGVHTPVSRIYKRACLAVVPMHPIISVFASHCISVQYSIYGV